MSKVLLNTSCVSQDVFFIFPKPFLVRLADFITDARDVSAFSRTYKHTLLVCYTYLCRIMGWNRFTRLDNQTFYEKLPSDSYLYYQCIKIQQMIWSRSGRSLVTYDMVTNLVKLNVYFQPKLFLTNLKTQIDDFLVCHYAICINDVNLFKRHWINAPYTSRIDTLFEEALKRANSLDLSILHFLIEIPYFAIFFEEYEDIIELIGHNWRVFNLFLEIRWIDSILIYEAVLTERANYLILHQCLTEDDIIESIRDQLDLWFFDNEYYDPDEIQAEEMDFHIFNIETLCKTDCLLPYLKPTVHSLLQSLYKRNMKEEYDELNKIKHKYF